MVTDVREEENGVFHLWGVTSRGDSVLARVPDFEPYFYVSAPDQTAEVTPEDVSALIGALNRCGVRGGGIQWVSCCICWLRCYLPQSPRGITWLAMLAQAHTGLYAAGPCRPTGGS